MPDATSCPECRERALYLSGTIFLCEACGAIEITNEGRRADKCLGCGYPLLGNSSGACPECGRSLTIAQRRAHGLLRRLVPAHRLVLALDRFDLMWGRRDTCPRCGYDTRYHSGHRCPECGEIVGRRAPIEERLAVLDGQLTEDRIRELLPDSAAMRAVFDVFTESGWDPLRAAATLLEGFAAENTGDLNDKVAARLLPPGKQGRGLYRQLRRLGHSEMETLRIIAPHARSFESWAHDPTWL